MLPSGEVIAFSKLVQVPDSTPETYSRFDNGVAMVEVISKEDFDNFRRDEMNRYTGLYNKACLDVHSHAEGVIGQSRRVINEDLDQFQRLQMSAASDARACLKATSNSLQFLFRPDSGWKAMMKELKEVVENLISYGSGADREARAAWRKDREEFRLNMTREEVVLKTQLATEQDRREQEIEKNNFFENHSVCQEYAGNYVESMLIKNHISSKSSLPEFLPSLLSLTIQHFHALMSPLLLMET